MPDDYEKFAQPRAEEELHQSQPAPVAMGTSPDDGLPMQMSSRNFDKSPPLNEETLICMADKRSFVVRDPDGSVWVSFTPAEVSRLPNGEYFVEVDAMLKKVNAGLSDLELDAEGAVLDRLDHLGALPHDLMLYTRRNGAMVAVVRVMPVRPECHHYLRMQTDLAADRDARYLQRACMKQRSEDGEYYSVRDSLIAACNLRYPRHYPSEALLDKFDEEKVSQAREREEQEEFDVDKALAAEGAGLGVLGGPA